MPLLTAPLMMLVQVAFAVFPTWICTCGVEPFSDNARGTPLSESTESRRTRISWLVRRVAIRPEVELRVESRRRRLGGGAEVVLHVVGVVALRLQAYVRRSALQTIVTFKREVVFVERLVEPQGAPPVSKPLEKIASGTTVTVALRMPLVPVLQLPAASRMRALTVYVPGVSEPTGMLAVRPLNCVPLPGAGAVVVGGLIQYSPPATPLARPRPEDRPRHSQSG